MLIITSDFNNGSFCVTRIYGPYSNRYMWFAHLNSGRKLTISFDRLRPLAIFVRGHHPVAYATMDYNGENLSISFLGKDIIHPTHLYFLRPADPKGTGLAILLFELSEEHQKPRMR